MTTWSTKLEDAPEGRKLWITLVEIGGRESVMAVRYGNHFKTKDRIVHLNVPSAWSISHNPQPYNPATDGVEY